MHVFGRQQVPEQPQPTNSTIEGGALTFENVRKVFGDHEALRSFSLEVYAGEFLSLLGPSGCGKTTLLRMIAGFEDPTEGRILLDGKDLTVLPPHRRPVNTVFQSYALFPHMSVADNVAYGLKRGKLKLSRAEITRRVTEALEMVRMDTHARRRPQELSGGQQQRVALARALVNRPRVLLLDEPMSALDRKLREDMQLELIRLHTDLGLTFIFVTHDQEEALAMSNRIVVLNNGVVQQVGESEEIYSRPANTFVAGFIGKQNFVPAVVERIGDRASARPTVLRAAREFVEVHTDFPLTVGQDVLATIRPELMRVRPGSCPDMSTNEITGVVVGESFLGDVVQYLVRLHDGHEVIARVSTVEAPEVSEGDIVTVSWSERAAQVFPKDEHTPHILSSHLGTPLSDTTDEVQA